MTHSVVKRARRTDWRRRVSLQKRLEAHSRRVSPPSTSSSVGSPSTNSPSAGSRKSTTVRGSTSVLSWPKTSPAARRSAGVLRAKPKIAWNKDRGKEVLKPVKRSKPPWVQDDEVTDVDESTELRPREEYPWFWNCPGDGPQAGCTDFLGGAGFDGNRWKRPALHERHEERRPRTEARAGDNSEAPP